MGNEASVPQLHRRPECVFVLFPQASADDAFLIEAISMSTSLPVRMFDDPQRAVDAMRNGLRPRSVLIDSNSCASVAHAVARLRAMDASIPVVALSDLPLSEIEGADETVRKDFRVPLDLLADRIRQGMVLASAMVALAHSRALTELAAG